MLKKNRNEWFEVSREGLRELQEGKPKTYVLRELVANAFDEEITQCSVELRKEPLTKSKYKLIIRVTDDGGGFADLKDAYTLFGQTAKRIDPTKRGRFTLGEKQSFAVAMFAEVITTKGSISFDENGRHNHPSFKSVKGTEVRCDIAATDDEIAMIREFAKRIIPPSGVEYTVLFRDYSDAKKTNRVQITRKMPMKCIMPTLPTEVSINGRMTSTNRITAVEIFEKEGTTAYLYECGIPVMPIECDYDLNVNQRIPMSVDRDKVSAAYMQHLFAEVLNATHDTLRPESASAGWVRTAASDNRITKDAIESVIRQRYGDKVVVATPTDPIANDDAIASGYRVIRGSELSGQEWERIREFGLLRSSHDVFGRDVTADATYVEPDENMKFVAILCKRIAEGYFGKSIEVKFIESAATAEATFGGDRLTFNVKRLGKDWFAPVSGGRVSRKVYGLIIHELSHYDGHHTEMSYHQTMQDLAGWLINEALDNPTFFREG